MSLRCGDEARVLRAGGGKDGESLWYRIAQERRIGSKRYLMQVHKVGFFVVLALAASFAIFVGVAVVGGFYKVVSIILSSNLYLYSLAFALVIAGYVLRFGKWSYYMRLARLRIALRKSVAVYMSLYSMDITPGRLGRLLVAYTLSRVTKTKMAAVVPVVIMDIFTDFAGIAVLALAMALLFHSYLIYVLIFDALLMLPFLVILNRWFFDLARKLLGGNSLFKRIVKHGERYYLSQSALNAPRSYAVSMLFTLPSTFINGMALYLTLLAVGVKTARLLPSEMVFSVTQIFGMVSGSPGNIGVTDAALIALVSSTFKLSVAVSSAVAIMSRFATLWLMTLIGAVFLAYTLRYWKKRGVASRASGVRHAS